MFICGIFTINKEVIDIWKELRVLASETSTELSNGVGVSDNANNADDIDKGSGGSKGKGEECES